MATLGLDGLDRGLADPLGLLTGGSRLDQRHRSLRAVLDWSISLLSPSEHAALRRASVFAGPFTAVAAADVVGFAPHPPAGVADALASLTDDHRWWCSTEPHGTRYRKLETIRQYAPWP